MSVCNELQPFLIAKCRLEKWQRMGGDELSAPELNTEDSETERESTQKTRGHP
jgi:hypothetical protein